MEYRIIKSPSQGTIEILKRRGAMKWQAQDEPAGCIEAIGLVQGRMIEMISAADIAEKAAGVTAEDIRGNCPQSMMLLALFGDTASVEAAIEEIKRSAGEVQKHGGGKTD